MAGGVELVRKLASSGVSVFVDAKLFDIGNTVERATARVADLGAAFLTVHAQDRQTLEAAVRGRAGSAETSGLRFSQAQPVRSERAGDHAHVGRSRAAARGICGGCRFRRRGLLGLGGARLEGDVPRAACFGLSRHPACIGNGVSGDDQARTATPGDALRAGADYIVVGRPILRASDPCAAARSIIAEIATALRDLQAPALDLRVTPGHENV